MRAIRFYQPGGKEREERWRNENFFWPSYPEEDRGRWRGRKKERGGIKTWKINQDIPFVLSMGKKGRGLIEVRPEGAKNICLCRWIKLDRTRKVLMPKAGMLIKTDFLTDLEKYSIIAASLEGFHTQTFSVLYEAVLTRPCK